MDEPGVNISTISPTYARVPEMNTKSPHDPSFSMASLHPNVQNHTLVQTETTHPLMGSLTSSATATQNTDGRFVCPSNGCGKSFKYQKGLTSHQDKKHGEKRFSCNECGKAFKLKWECSKHEKSHGSKADIIEPESICPIDGCGKLFKSEKALRKHKKEAHGEKTYACEVCHQRFTRSYDFARHEKTHNELKEFRCTFCEKGFHRKEDLNKHLRNIHQDLDIQNPDGNLTQTINSSLAHTTQSPIHAETSQTIFALSNVQNSAGILTEKTNLLPVHKTEFDRRTSTSLPMNFEVPEISEHPIHTANSSTDKQDLQNYPVSLDSQDSAGNLSVFRETPSSAPDSSQVGLSTLPISSTENTELRYVCPNDGCGKSFKYEKGLKRHQDETHGVKRYSCSKCSEAFLLMWECKKHEKSHNSEVEKPKPMYACSINECGKLLNSQKSLKKHEKDAHGEKTYTCGVCFQMFSRKYDCTRHEKTHNSPPKEFNCMNCEKCYYRKEDLNKHIRNKHQDAHQNE